MTDLRTAAQLAVTMLKTGTPEYDAQDVLEVLEAALEQPEQEPVAFMYVGIKHDGTTHGPHLVWKPEHMDAMSAEKGVRAVPLFTHPPRREWRGLTEEEMEDVWMRAPQSPSMRECLQKYARAIEAALRSKNHE